jgi:hypothetical protein
MKIRNERGSHELKIGRLFKSIHDDIEQFVGNFAMFRIMFAKVTSMRLCRIFMFKFKYPDSEW